MKALGGLLILATITAVLLPTDVAGNHTGDTTTWYDFNQLFVGQILLAGVANDTGCEYAAWGVHMENPGGLEMALGVENTDDCRLEVVRLSTTPVLYKSWPFGSDEDAPQSPDYNNDSGMSTSSVTTSPPPEWQSVQVVVDYWHYGGGGSWDRLTSREAGIVFAYDPDPDNYDFQAQMIESKDICNNDSWFTGWAIIECFTTWEEWGPGVVVGQEGYGWYYWTPCPVCFEHELWTELRGYGTGNTDCDYYYRGYIVRGTDHVCTVTYID